jgi:hypothetical protein
VHKLGSFICSLLLSGLCWGGLSFVVLWTYQLLRAETLKGLEEKRVQRAFLATVTMATAAGMLWYLAGLGWRYMAR